jgi:hypothetical protein
VSGQAGAATVTFVSPVGSDANNCATASLPCRQLSGATAALAKTDEGGVIHVLPGDYDTFVIDKSIEILVDGGQASVAASAQGIPGGGGTAQIIVNAGAGDKVRIRGFVLNGATLGVHGIAFIAGGALHLEDCTFVSPGSNFGIAFRPAGASELYVSNGAITGSGSGATGGIQIRPTGSGSAKVVFDNVRVADNNIGILIDGTATTGTNSVTLRNSVVSGSAGIGIQGVDSGGGASNVVIEGSTISSNASVGIRAVGANTAIRLRNSTVSGNGTGIAAQNGGKLISHGGNLVAGNGANGAFTQVVAPQ